MKRNIAILVAVFALAIASVWCLLPFKIGAFEYSTPMSPENLILVRPGSEDRVASHLRGVTDYVSRLGANLAVESYTREETHPLSRFLPLPHSCAAPYRVVVTFRDERGERYSAIFSGAIDLETRGLASPRYLTWQARKCIDEFIETVFQKSPSALQSLLHR